jgi:putative endonuclease
MAKHNELGIWGEQTAQTRLAAAGYTILATNYRYGKAEIDIIAKIGSDLVFIEVKTRTGSQFALPEASVSATKQKLILEAATQYMYETQYEDEFRFDIIAIIVNKNNQITDYQHFIDAFFPNWL